VACAAGCHQGLQLRRRARTVPTAVRTRRAPTTRRRTGDRCGGRIHAQFCQGGIRRIITAGSVLSCKDSPGEQQVTSNGSVTQVKVAVTGPDHVGMVTATPAGPFPGA
jgi:hypothetical protein